MNMPETESEEEDDADDSDMLIAEHMRNDALEGILGALKEMVKKTNQGAPDVHVAAPSVTVQSPQAPSVTVQAPPAAAVTVNVPKPPQKWTVEITDRDSRGQIKKFTMTAS